MRPLGAPHQLFVVGDRGIEHSCLAGRNRHQVHAVAEPLCAGNGVGKEFACVVERRLPDVADVALILRRGLIHDHVRAGRCARRGGSATTSAASAAGGRRIGCRRRGVLRTNEQPLAVGGKAEARDCGERRFRASLEVDDLERPRCGGSACARGCSAAPAAWRRAASAGTTSAGRRVNEIGGPP
jgi:hypothetical protein